MDDPAKRDEALKVLKENHVSAANYLLNTTDRDRFAEALDKLWSNELENDGLNKLVLRAGLAWREIAVLRSA